MIRICCPCQDPHGAVDLFVLQSLYSVAWNEKETISLGICFECGVRELAPIFNRIYI